MKRGNALLLYRFDLNETHGGPCGSLTNRFSVRRIILAPRTTLAVWGTNCGAISLTEWPIAVSLRAQ